MKHILVLLLIFSASAFSAAKLPVLSEYCLSDIKQIGGYGIYNANIFCGSKKFIFGSTGGLFGISSRPVPKLTADLEAAMLSMSSTKVATVGSLSIFKLNATQSDLSAQYCLLTTNTDRTSGRISCTSKDVESFSSSSIKILEGELERNGYTKAAALYYEKHQRFVVEIYKK